MRSPTASDGCATSPAAREMPCHTYRPPADTSVRAESCAAAGGAATTNPARHDQACRTGSNLRQVSAVRWRFDSAPGHCWWSPLAELLPCGQRREGRHSMTRQQPIESRQVPLHDLPPALDQLPELVAARAGDRQHRLSRGVVGVVLQGEIESKLAIQVNKTPYGRSRLPCFAGIAQ